MMSEPTFRQATIHDAEVIASVVNRVVEEPNPVGFAGPTTAEQVRTWLTRQGGEGGIFLSTIDDEVVGFSAIDFDTREPETAVIGVWILPDHRRSGLGTALAGYAFGFARDKGYRRIRGRLPEHNQVALSFLSSIGALVPMYNPDAIYGLPIYDERRD